MNITNRVELMRLQTAEGREKLLLATKDESMAEITAAINKMLIDAYFYVEQEEHAEDSRRKAESELMALAGFLDDARGHINGAVDILKQSVTRLSSGR